jgi:hypothetical protein
MGNFTPQTRQTIASFVATMDFPGMPPAAADGSYSFLFAKTGILTLLATDDGAHVLVGLARQPSSSDSTYAERFFAAAGLDEHTNMPLHAGLAPNGAFMYVAPVRTDQFDLPTLEQRFTTLCAAHDALDSY